MSNDTVVSLAAPALVPDPLTELLRSGARRLIEAAVRAEFEEYLSSFGHEKLPDGRQRVVRNGHLPEHKILTGLGEVDVRVPKARMPLGLPGAVPLLGGAALRSALREPRCGDPEAVPARGVDRGRCVRRSARCRERGLPARGGSRAGHDPAGNMPTLPAVHPMPRRSEAKPRRPSVPPVSAGAPGRMRRLSGPVKHGRRHTHHRAAQRRAARRGDRRYPPRAGARRRGEREDPGARPSCRLARRDRAGAAFRDPCRDLHQQGGARDAGAHRGDPRIAPSAGCGSARSMASPIASSVPTGRRRSWGSRSRSPTATISSASCGASCAR